MADSHTQATGKVSDTPLQVRLAWEFPGGLVNG